MAVSPPLPLAETASRVLVAEADRRLAAGDACGALRLFEDAARGPHAAYAELRRGQLLQARGEHARARAALTRARALKPDDTSIHCALAHLARDQGYPGPQAPPPPRAQAVAAAVKLAAVLRSQNRLDEAERVIARTQLRAGSSAGLLHESGLIALDRDRADDAATALRAALALEPNRAATRAALAAALLDLGREAEALQELDLAIPDLTDPGQAGMNRAWALFALDRWDEGWEALETRFDAPAVSSSTRRPAHFKLPRWRGEHMTGALYVWGDQGLGDEIVAVSLLPRLRARGIEVVLECSPRLASLFARTLPAQRIVPRHDGEVRHGRDCDAQIAASSLFGILDWTPRTAQPREFLRANPQRIAAARARHATPGRQLVGLSWASNDVSLSRRKTLPLAALEQLTAIPGAVLLDLQYGDTAETRLALAGRTGANIRRDVEIDVTNDLDGLAALIGACDVVVTSSNVTAHLAGALGATTHVLVPTGRARSWYWPASESNSPFYPHLTLHHQTRDGSWRPAIDEVHAALTPPIR